MKTIMFILIAGALVVTGCGKREVRKSATLNLDFEVEANTDSALVFQTAGMLSTITNASISGSGTITPKAVTLTAPTGTKVYDGQEIKFCCKACVPKFEKNPAKYLAKLP